MRLDFRAHGRRPPAACLVRNSPPVEKITIEKTYAGDTRNDAKVLLLLINTITAHVSLYMVTCLLVLFTFSSDSLFDHLCPVYDESICKIHSSLPFFFPYYTRNKFVISFFKIFKCCYYQGNHPQNKMCTNIIVNGM